MFCSYLRGRRRFWWSVQMYCWFEGQIRCVSHLSLNRLQTHDLRSFRKGPSVQFTSQWAGHRRFRHRCCGRWCYHNRRDPVCWLHLPCLWPGFVLDVSWIERIKLMLNRLIIQAQTGVQWFVELKLRLVTDRERSSKIPLQIRQLVRVRRTHYTSAVWSRWTRRTVPFAERGGLLCSLSRRQGQFHEFARKQDIERVTAGSTRCVNLHVCFWMWTQSESDVFCFLPLHLACWL